MNLTDAIITEHALGRLAKRMIAQTDVCRILANPEQVLPVRPGRVVAQGMCGQHLLRVFVDNDRTPPEVVTAYRTSKIDKYRNKP